MHILSRRPWLEPFLKTIELVLKDPEVVYQSPTGDEFHAVRKLEDFLTDNLVVIYKIISAKDGFVISVIPMSEKNKKRRYRTWSQKYP